MTPKQLELNSLLLQYEMQVLALYDLQSADPSADDYLDVDLDKSIAKRRADKERLRGKILGYAA
jgi:hypothetical protein